MPVKFDVVAHFSPPIAGRRMAHTREERVEHVFAETPEAAARIWLWRLSEVERRATVRLVVFAPKPKAIVPQYDGTPVRFRREGGQLVPLGQSPGDQTGSAPRTQP
jgi:hypothetical protein